MAFEDYNYSMINPYVMVEGDQPQPDVHHRKTDPVTINNVNSIAQAYDNFAVPKNDEKEPSQHEL